MAFHNPLLSLLKRRAQRQYLSSFDLLDVRQDERHEVVGESAKAGVLIGHPAAIRTETRGWVMTSALRRVVVNKVSSEEATSSLKK